METVVTSSEQKHITAVFIGACAEPLLDIIDTNLQRVRICKQRQQATLMCGVIHQERFYNIKMGEKKINKKNKSPLVGGKLGSHSLTRGKQMELLQM